VGPWGRGRIWPPARGGNHAATERSSPVRGRHADGVHHGGRIGRESALQARGRTHVHDQRIRFQPDRGLPREPRGAWERRCDRERHGERIRRVSVSEPRRQPGAGSEQGAGRSADRSDHDPERIREERERHVHDEPEHVDGGADGVRSRCWMPERQLDRREPNPFDHADQHDDRSGWHHAVHVRICDRSERTVRYRVAELLRSGTRIGRGAA